MVGIIAMAKVEEYNHQPCKKPRKDVDDSSTNTITSYFLPVSKSVDKDFPSPKSSNILDYFKKTPTHGQQVTSSPPSQCEAPVVTYVDCGKESTVTLEGKSHQTPKRKRPYRRVNLSRRLNECQEVVEISEDNSDSNSTDECRVRSGIGVLGSDTAALLAQLCAESPHLFRKIEEVDCEDLNDKQRTEVGSRKKNWKEPVNRLNKSESKKSQKRKLVRDKDKDSLRQLDVQPVPKNDCCSREAEEVEAKEANDLVIESEEKHPVETGEEASPLNDSTVTVAFEDFIKIQGTEEALTAEGREWENPVNMIQGNNEEAPTLMEGESLAITQPISPKTMTVRVQIHSNPVSTSPLISGKKSKKIASIFLKKKPDFDTNDVEAIPLSPNPTDPVPARRSNVVISEEELELSVLDVTEQSPIKAKCSRVEKEQFMNAFRQPSAELAKSGLKKALGKPKVLKASQDEGVEEVDACSSQEKDELASAESAHILARCSEESAVGKRNSKGQSVKRRNKLKCKRISHKIVKGNLKVDGYELIENGNDDLDGNSIDLKELGTKDPSTTQSNDSPKRLTRRSFRQQRNAVDYCSTPARDAKMNRTSARARMSTPKITSWSEEENSIYKAEMILSNSDTESPFRMKFTRLTLSGAPVKRSGVDENKAFTPRSNKRASKNVAKAKQLVQKAKAFEQNKGRSPIKSPTPLRRSTRQQIRCDSKAPGTELSAVLLATTLGCEPVAKSQQDQKKAKKLRNVKDVLGKNPDSTKSAKSEAGDLKVASIFIGKKVPRTVTSGPITILDEDSCNYSENSQDGERFRAKREFLMSGLPVTLKKHIAKTTAAMEAYSSACLSFQPVTHIHQQSQVSPLWNLPWPNCSLLNHLREVTAGMGGLRKLSLSLGDFSEVKCRLQFPTESRPVLVSTWRREFSEAIRKRLLEEIRSSNSEFPVRRVFKPLLQKRNEHLALMESTKPAGGGPFAVTPSDNSQQPLGKRKRKREDQEMRKKRRKAADELEDSVIIIESQDYLGLSGAPAPGLGTRWQDQPPAHPPGRLSRSRRRQEAIATETQSEVPSTTTRTEAAATEDAVKEDLLWTEKYQPQRSSELVGNLKAIKQLHSWLMEWKRRADREERKKQKEKTIEKEKRSDAWDNSDFDLQSSEDEDFLCNTVLITGPPGVGKTAAVYACAQELGFKVFEVNASSQRSGRQILSQLKEATQSHQVDKQGATVFKPAFFSNYSTIGKPLQSAKSQRKINSPKKVISSPRKSPKSPRGRSTKKSLAPMSLATFFKAASKPNKTEATEKIEEEADGKTPKDGKCQRSSPQVAEASSVTQTKDTACEEPNRKSATSLILFEEVDVILDDDYGFLNGIKTFMATAKRPVILTTSDSNFSLMFDGCLDEIHFKIPPSVSVASYLQLLCLAENMRTDAKDLSALLALNKSDIRRSMLHLQYWVRSGGARLPTADSQDNSDLRDEDVPLCDTGCAEQLLGLKTSSGPHQDVFSVFKQAGPTVEEQRKQVQLLLEFQRRRLDFMSCNLERLLPLPKQIIAEPREPADNADLTEPVLRGSGLMEKSQPQQHDRPADSRPPKAVTKTYQRRKVELFDSDLFDSELNLSNSFLTLPSEIPATGSDLDSADSNCLDSLSSGSSKNRLNCSHDGANKPRTLAEQKCCELVSVCLGSLVEFMDSASFLDSCLRSHSVETEGWCGRDRYHWSAAEVKSGMLDERRLEQGDWWVPHHFGEVRATVEAMSWKKCQSRMAQAIETSVPECRELGVDPTGELTLSISQAASHKDVMYSQHSHYHTSTAMKRVEVGKSVFTSKAFACLGNRQASAVEYLPVLRTICRAEKQKEQGKLKRRFLHYLDGIHLEIPKGTLERLAADFP
ncbi:ATPase family AAA domain-containing protein 5 isoform X1 [Callorhinchus milii]|uniref:ATPase family AAA domain-containing protein 5 isoform X1 n=1 Tax=Callorhinchus milii TaxID=7868 RepID=UPI001C3FD251|nr:ATPase family AAA domain-containing protein 5 isoform X1 [Callorhinchus milii]XP_007886611.2 ATPase family AAA domain-containing protein 5 isoform X1 [Callorhinchus milii]XP_007886612.2 ATPase family AAA domain-containing protein 5 isoform X1 [Callorhinchus milii]